MAASGESRGSLFIRWRWMMYMSIFMGWSLYSLCRKSLPSSMPSLIKHNNLSKDDIGSMTSSFAIAYGISKFFFAVLSDHVSAKVMFSTGLGLSGICCLFFPLTNSVIAGSAIWFIAGIVQGCGWAPCAKLLKEWYPSSQMGTWWSILSSSSNIAGAIVPLLISYITYLTSWRLSFFLIGGVAISFSLLILVTVKNSPTELGLQTYLSSHKKQDSNGRPKNEKEALQTNWYDVFFLGNLWVVSAVYATIYLLKNSLFDWSQLYFIQVAGKPETTAAACVGMMQIGGLGGNLTMGYVSDCFITPRTEQTKCPRAPVLFGISLLLTLFFQLFVSTVNEDSSEIWLTAMMFSGGFLLDGGIAVIGLVAMEIVPNRLAGSAHGLACAVAQIGGFSAGWPFAHTIERYSWATAYRLLELSSMIMAVLCSYLLVLLFRRLAQSQPSKKAD